jgi:hypothetical protein
MRIPIVMLSGQAGSGKDTVASFLVKNHGAVAIAQADPMKRLVMELFGFSEEQLWGPSAKRNEPDEAARERAEEFMRANRWTEVAFSWLIDLFGEVGGSNELYLWFDACRKDPAPLTPRRVLQTLGTEWGRAFSKNMWVDYALRTAGKLLEGGGTWYDRTLGVQTVPAKVTLAHQEAARRAPGLVAITDGRFRNELLAVRAAGGATVRIVSPGSGLAGSAATHSSEVEQMSVPESWFDVVLENRKEYGFAALEQSVGQMTQQLLPYPMRFRTIPVGYPDGYPEEAA